MTRGIALLIVHLVILGGLAGKAYWDREHLPRTWVRAEPIDPASPLRGRYVLLQAVVPGQPNPVRLSYFIPERVPDPSRRPPGEELWVEVLLPPAGLPRPVRLGIKSEGVLTPLEFR